MLHDDAPDRVDHSGIEVAPIDNRESERVLMALIGCIVVAQGGDFGPPAGEHPGRGE